jgi:hypothetical protein
MSTTSITTQGVSEGARSRERALGWIAGRLQWERTLAELRGTPSPSDAIRRARRPEAA